MSPKPMTQPPLQKPIRVETDVTSAPYIRLPVAQLDWVRKRLEDNGVDFRVDHMSVSVDGKPAVTMIYLSRQCDPDRVQAILDEADRVGAS